MNTQKTIMVCTALICLAIAVFGSAKAAPPATAECVGVSAVYISDMKEIVLFRAFNDGSVQQHYDDGWKDEIRLYTRGLRPR